MSRKKYLESAEKLYKQHLCCGCARDTMMGERVYHVLSAVKHEATSVKYRSSSLVLPHELDPSKVWFKPAHKTQLQLINVGDQVMRTRMYKECMRSLFERSKFSHLLEPPHAPRTYSVSKDDYERILRMPVFEAVVNYEFGRVVFTRSIERTPNPFIFELRPMGRTPVRTWLYLCSHRRILMGHSYIEPGHNHFKTVWITPAWITWSQVVRGPMPCLFEDEYIHFGGAQPAQYDAVIDLS